MFTFFCALGRPENVPRLFDLVKPKDDKFLTAFYFALRDTLVAKDLDQATRIGLQVMLSFDTKKKFVFHVVCCIPLVCWRVVNRVQCFPQLQGRTRYRVVTLDGQLIDIAGERTNHWKMNIRSFISVPPSPLTSRPPKKKKNPSSAYIPSLLPFSLSPLFRHHEWWWQQGSSRSYVLKASV